MRERNYHMSSNNETKELLDFIAASPTCFQAVKNITDRLENEGYTRLSETGEWNLSRGGKYCVTRNQSSVIAFRIPENGIKCFMISAAHSDSPSFRIKENAESDTAGFYTRINVEKYGGMICHSWIDRPLSAAGRVTYRDNGAIVSKPVDLDRDLFIIPSVAIHMNRSTNDNASFNPAVDMQPISCSLRAKGAYGKLLAAACGCDEKDILSADMFLYTRESGRIWGAFDEFVSSPRLDDLQCVFGTMKGFLNAKPSAACPVFCVFDNEEVGSETKQGAASTFLQSTLERINEALGGKLSDYLSALASGFMVSADNAHAVHPNHPEYADTPHRPAMNGGIVIKHNANQRYTTDSVSSAVFSEICAKAGVPVQHFANRADIPGGSTLGNISNTKVPLNTVDIGMPQLSMHSSYETAGADDTGYLIKAMTEFFGTAISADSDGKLILC